MDPNAIPKDMFEVNDILKRYSNIHNEFFKSSFLKFIPGFAKPVDYAGHVKNLSDLQSKLQRIDNSLKEEDQLDSPFGKYAHGLLETVTFLKDMGDKLVAKNQGSSSYTDQAYKEDVDKYNKLAANHRSLASEFNKTVAMD